jgi:hypothetical protein
MRTATLAITLLFALSAAAQERITENTVRLGEAQPQKATVADMAWLAGSWSGTGLGGRTEEVWSAPDGGTMVGHFRLVRDDKAVFYEIMTLLETPDGFAMRLKHVNPDMTGWEEKDKYVEFRYVRTVGNLVQFSGLTFRRDSDNEITIFLALRQKDGSVKEMPFKMTRKR